MNEAPVIETARLRLRGHRVEDASSTAALWADADVTRFIGGRPLTEEESWTRVLRYAGSWALLGFGYWLVEEKDTGAFVGEIGFANMHREIAPSLGDAPEIGWVLATRAHGKGYATEAVNAALDWCGQRFPGRRTVCIIAPDNQASRRVAEKAGYRETRRATYKDREVIVLER
jgi:RimJ/RimL family protein N-acetyltransferase